MTLARLAVPLATALFFLAAVAWPLARLWLRTGRFGLVLHRGADPWRAAVGLAFGASMVGLGVWAAALGVLGPERLGVVTVGPAVSALGWVLFAAGFALTVAAQAGMGSSWRIGIDDRPTALVQDGLYAWVRNPIYTGIGTMLLGLVLVAPSAWAGLELVVVGGLLALQTRLEERHLAALHGEAFDAWASRVGRFLPGLGRLRPAGRG